MAVTKYFLTAGNTHGLTPSGDAAWRDLSTTAGGGPSTVQATPTAGGTEIQFLNVGSTIGWISPAAPAGGFTLTTTDINLWLAEASMSDNCGGRYRIFKRSAAGVITEVGGGPFNDGVEMAVTTRAAHAWVGDVTDTVFAQNDRILLRCYITNIGTMAAGSAATLSFNGATPGSDGDSFLNVTTTTGGSTFNDAGTDGAKGTDAATPTLIFGPRPAYARRYQQAVQRSVNW